MRAPRPPSDRGTWPTRQRCCISLRSSSIHGRHARRLYRCRNRPCARPHRTIRRPTANQPRHRVSTTGQATTPARRNARDRTVDHVRPQRNHSQLVAELRQHPRTCRSLRRASPFLVPKRGLPHVCHRGRHRHDRIHPSALRGARRGRSAHLLRRSTERPRLRSLESTLRRDRALSSGRTRGRNGCQLSPGYPVHPMLTWSQANWLPHRSGGVLAKPFISWLGR
jgi:hypothetical protein